MLAFLGTYSVATGAQAAVFVVQHKKGACLVLVRKDQNALGSFL